MSFFIPLWQKIRAHTNNKKEQIGVENPRTSLRLKEQTPDRQTPAKSMRLKAAKGSAQKVYTTLWLRVWFLQERERPV